MNLEWRLSRRGIWFSLQIQFQSPSVELDLGSRVGSGARGPGGGGSAAERAGERADFGRLVQVARGVVDGQVVGAGRARSDAQRVGEGAAEFPGRGVVAFGGDQLFNLDRTRSQAGVGALRPGFARFARFRFGHVRNFGIRAEARVRHRVRVESVVEHDPRVVLRGRRGEHGREAALLGDQAHVALHLLFVDRRVRQQLAGALNSGQLRGHLDHIAERQVVRLAALWHVLLFESGRPLADQGLRRLHISGHLGWGSAVFTYI